MKVPCDKIETSIADNTKDCHREKYFFIVLYSASYKEINVRSLL